MEKVAFYLYNKDNPDTDFTNVEQGNPGIGGSEFLTALVVQLLSKRDNGIDIVLYTSVDTKMPDGLHHCVTGTIQEALQDAMKLGIKTFVADKKRFCDADMSKSYGNMRIVYWCHNFQGRQELKKMVQSPSLGRIVAVGREQMDIYRDSIAFNYSDYIYNCVPVPEKYLHAAKSIPLESRAHNVAYLGSLVPGKCFHVLAEIWPEILKQVPDAQLYVIGSAKVYDENVSLGRYGISAEDYEKMFMPYLTDSEGNVISSVHFLGTLGEEKYGILKNVRVGCPNPAGLSETFCLSAVEMQAMGCAVAAMEAPGYYDSFFNGKIARNKKELVGHIVSLLKGATVKPYTDTIAYINQHFSPHVIAEDWERLLLSDMKCHLHSVCPLHHKWYRMKWMKELLRRVKIKWPLLYCLPIIERVFNLKSKLTEIF